MQYIAIFTTSIQHIAGKDNVVADTLSRIDALASVTVELIDDQLHAKALTAIDALLLPTIFSIRELSEKQASDQQLQEILADNSRPLKLQKLTWGESHLLIHCNTHDSVIRPYLPFGLREQIFNAFHQPAHASARCTAKMIRQHYIWPKMSTQIGKWAKACLDCQKSKISRRNKFLPQKFIETDTRFNHVHLDLVGPPTESSGYKYLFTMIDRYTR